MKRISVAPASEFEKRSRLFNAFERAFPVRFAGGHPADGPACDGAIFLGVKPDDGDALPFLAMNAAAGDRRESRWIEFLDVPEVDRRLRGRRLVDRQLGGLGSCPGGPQVQVLALSDGQPVWARHRSGTGGWAASLPGELGAHETLRDRLRETSFFSLLPMVQFLREVTRGLALEPPPLRAAFLFDDPNLHGRSYGHMRFPELAAHAQEHGYHVSCATIPLDGWWVNPRAAEIFRRHQARLSLCMHGNNHTYHELAAPGSLDASLALVSQALRRVWRLERTSGCSVDRIMVAPHCVCGQTTMRAMGLLGQEAICISRPYPWLEHAPSDDPLAQWGIGDVVEGLPVIPRWPLAWSDDDIVFRSYLDQPLVLYGHHDDLAPGLNVLAARAEMVNSLGEVTWCRLREISRTNLLKRSEGSTLHVRLVSRRVRVEVPAGVDIIRLDGPFQWDAEEIRADGGTVLVDRAIELSPEVSRVGAVVEISVHPRDARDPANIPSPRFSVRPWIRRALTESRDRVRPWSSRLVH